MTLHKHMTHTTTIQLTRGSSQSQLQRDIRGQSPEGNVLIEKQEKSSIESCISATSSESGSGSLTLR